MRMNASFEPSGLVGGRRLHGVARLALALGMSAALASPALAQKDAGATNSNQSRLRPLDVKIGEIRSMTVGPDLLKAAEANDPAAIDMVSIWGLGFRAELGGSLAPGLWMHQGAQRVLQQTRPGVLYKDLNACNAYQNALTAAAQVKVPATFILGERDMMTPAKAGRTLAAATPNSRTVVVPGAGHMIMAEAPDELLAALRQ